MMVDGQVTVELDLIEVDMVIFHVTLEHLAYFTCRRRTQIGRTEYAGILRRQPNSG